MPKPIVIESPYNGGEPIDRSNLLNRATNRTYALAAVDDCLHRGEAPFASHLIYPLVLDEDEPAERDLGIDCQKAWIDVAKAIAVYVDRGISPGMAEAIKYALAQGYSIEMRSLEGRHINDLAPAVEAALPMRELLWRRITLDASISTAYTPAPSTSAPPIDPAESPFGQAPAYEAASETTIVRPVARPDGPASSWGGAGNG